MRMQHRVIGLAAAALVGFAGAAHAQQPVKPQQPARTSPPSTVPANGISDIGSFEQVPYRLEPQMNLRAEDRMTLRKLEDKHIGELRSLEDRYEKDLRTLRARQQSERDTMVKSFGAKR
ncbi:MAG TPA: hypothetical protein VF876_09920 [Burkholderiales bacterium]